MPEADKMKTSPAKLGPRDMSVWCQVGAGDSFPQSNQETSLGWAENRRAFPPARWFAGTQAVPDTCPFLLPWVLLGPSLKSGHDEGPQQTAPPPCPAFWDTTAKGHSGSKRKASVGLNQRFLPDNIGKCSYAVSGTVGFTFLLILLSGH